MSFAPGLNHFAVGIVTIECSKMENLALETVPLLHHRRFHHQVGRQARHPYSMVALTKMNHQNRKNPLVKSQTANSSRIDSPIHTEGTFVAAAAVDEDFDALDPDQAAANGGDLAADSYHPLLLSLAP
ncbi:Hypothetical predicted protein [Olea europaea subsp. europaea]|uniref:Uncharacterized protein n=1 Tax=Olea europaea subsp. europaea TaxID=158383 RepID=A0A8S0UWT7_OLEEU|nr:Hypothetical predicted protein [Olea europaea subsp. europaea]